MKPLGEDWFAVGEVYFRFLHLFDMPWGAGFSFDRFKLAVCDASGHIVMLLDGQPGCKPVLQIYTAAGKLVSQQLWKDAPPLAIGWSIEEELLVVQKTGFVCILDLCGTFVRRFTMGPEAEERGILDARFFNFHGHTGVAVLTGGNRIFLTSKIDTPRIRRLAELSGPTQAVALWEIITCPLDLGSTKTGSNANAFHGPWALISRANSLFRADFSTAENIEIPAITQMNSRIRLMAVSANMKFVSLCLENGYLFVMNLRMSEIHSQIDLTQRISVLLPTSELDQSVTQFNYPRAMLWSTNSAVVLQWTHLIALVGAQGDIYESFCPEDIWLAQEMDAVRMLTPTSHKLLQRVPPALEALGRIGASCPATWLLSASANLQLGSGRANDYLLPIRTSRQLTEAISHCIEAASHAVLDPKCQQNLLEAAHMGRIFLSAMFTDPEERPGEKVTKELSERAANVCRCLRVLNNLATPWIGLALTWTQFQYLGPRRLLERLLARKHYPMAIEFVRVMPESKPSVDCSSRKSSHTELGISLTQVLAHWACHSPSAGIEDSAAIGERLARIVERIYCPGSCSSPLSEVSGGPARTDPARFIPSLNGRATIDFADVASQALVANREKVAEQLIEYEARAWHQVPLLLKLGRYNRALVRAVETGDPELIAVVVAALQDQAKLPPADLAMVLRRHPIAMAIYHETWGSGPVASSATHNAIVSFDQEDDRAAEAKKAVLQAYGEANLQLRLNAMQRAEETYKQLKNDFMSQECNAAIRLLRFQSKLEKQELKAPVFEFANSLNDDPYSAHLILPVVAPTSVEETSWVGQPLNTTLARLLAIPHGERHADQLRREFRVSEKRFAHLRLIGLALQGDCWSEIEKMSKAKRLPINLETLIKVCVDCNHFEEAQSLVPRLPVERRVRFWLMCGQIEQAIQAAVREKSDSDLRLIQEHVGKGNDAMYSRIAALRQQIRV
ncbi:Vacuolar protein sorting-associated protein 16 [Clonorchis sinensis]|uniref:Vacuolar protein sorting-associated protein 16 homolog n=2 Tax=Clonorchis sinensis TaxID=79923 RepID=A0A8T1M9N3_CLOSI|nr:Vacuolar protein sorting-associated protein 16 [Clonorchis sinensis]